MDVDVADVAATRAALARTAAGLLARPVSADIFTRARAPMLERLDNALKSNAGWLALTALSAIGTLGSLAISTGEKTYIPLVSETLNLITDALTSLFTDFAKAVVNLQWGGFCLVGGILLMLVVGLIWRKY